MKNYREKKESPTLQDIFEIVLFTKENGAAQKSVDKRFIEMEGSMNDGFASIRTELKEIMDELDDVKQSLARLEKKTQEDDDAVTTEYVWLKKKVQTLEQRVKVLEKTHA